MVVLARLSWIRKQILAGGCISVHFTYNTVTAKDKVRFILHRTQATPIAAAANSSSLLLSALDLVANAAICSVVVDRGHRYSNGASEACFWIHRPKALEPDGTRQGKSLLLDTSMPDDADLDETCPLDAMTSPDEVHLGHGNGSINGNSACSSWDANAAADSADSPAISSFDIRLEEKVANSSLDDAVAGNTSPPRKRVRFSLQNDILFVDANTLAPQSLDEFLTGVPSISQSLAEFVVDVPPISLPAAGTELEASILKAYTFLRENSCELQNCVAASQLFLPGDKHHDLLLRCSYLMGKFEAIFDLQARGPNDIKKLRDEFDDNYDALAEIYVGIKDDFERCINSARIRKVAADEANLAC